MDTRTALRQLKIKTGSLKRNKGDYVSYSNEKITLENKLQKLQEEEADESKIKMVQNELGDTISVIGTLKPRIVTALEDLEGHMDSNDENAELKEAPEWQTALDIIQQVKDFLENI